MDQKLNEEIKYDIKEWTQNDVVTSKDLNNIEKGVEILVQEHNKATKTINDKIIVLSDLCATVEKCKERLEMVEEIAEIAVTSNNFRTAIEPHLSINRFAQLHIDGKTLSIQYKNYGGNVLKYMYYKRTSTGDVDIKMSCVFPESKHALWGSARYYTIATLDEGTNDMTNFDISHFARVNFKTITSKARTEFIIDDGALKLKVELYGYGLIPVSATFDITFSSYNDSNFI